MGLTRIRRVGLFLALASVAVLHLHVLAHVFGWDHDGDAPGSAPCVLCQTVLSQTAVAADTSVALPPVPRAWWVAPLPPLRLPPAAFRSTPVGRGPPPSSFA